MPKVSVEAALGADLSQGSGAYVWTDVTQYVRARNRVTITQGRADGYTIMPPSTLHLDVDNRDGRWVARNPNGAWFGLIRRNTPIRVLVDPASYVTEGLATFGTSSASGWPALDTGQTWSLSGLGGSVLATDFTSSSGTGIQSVPTTSAFRLALMTARPQLTDASVSLQVSCPVPTGGNLEPGGIYLRSSSDGATQYNCRVQVTTGAAVQVLIFRNGSTLIGPVTVSGLTHSAGTPLNVRAECYGSTVRMRVWQGSIEPVGVWHVSVVDASPIASPGYVGVRSGVASGNTNTKPVLFTYDNITITRPPVRFAGYIDELPVSWPSHPDADSTVGIVASGFLRRLNQGDAPLRSALYRTRTSRGYAQPIDYWPMEDDTNATQFANAVTGGQPMTKADQSPAASSIAQGSASLPTFGTLYARSVVRAFSSTEYGVRLTMAATALPGSTISPIQWRTANLRFVVTWTSGGTVFLQAYDNTNTEMLGAAGIAGFGTFYLNRALELSVNISTSGSALAWSISIVYYPPDGTAGFISTDSGTVASTVVEMPTLVLLGFPSGVSGWTFGHFAVYPSTASSPPSAALVGWVGNRATERIAGVCSDALIPVSVLDDNTGRVTTLGPQGTLSLPALIQESATADAGILFEREFGLMYLARYELYNRAVDLSVDHLLGQLADIEPTDDDQQVRNDVTVSRTSGSSARVVDDTHVALYGRYDDAVTLNLQFDTDVVLQAYWRLALGTVDDVRYPGIVLDLIGNPELITAWKKCGVGSRVQIVHPPKQLPPDAIDLLLQGWTEVVDDGGNVWAVTLNATPYRPYVVFTIEGGGNLGRLSSGVSFLTSGVTATTTSVSVTTPATLSQPWVTGSVNFPLWCDGEVMTVTNISGASSPQTFTVVRSVNGVVKAHSANASIDLYKPGVVAL